MTLYTNENEQLAGELKVALNMAPAPITINPRNVTRFVKTPERARITLHFEDRTSITEAFLAHMPRTKLRSSLAQQLGCAIIPIQTIVINLPFNQTSIKGAFAAGDC